MCAVAARWGCNGSGPCMFGGTHMFSHGRPEASHIQGAPWQASTGRAAPGAHMPGARAKSLDAGASHNGATVVRMHAGGVAAPLGVAVVGLSGKGNGGMATVVAGTGSRPKGAEAWPAVFPERSI